MLARSLALVPRWRWWGGFLLVGFAAGGLTLVAYREGLPIALNQIWQCDKIMHFLIAGLLAFFLDGALAGRALAPASGIAVPIAAIGLLVPMGIEECLQGLSALRNPSIWDFASDVAGVLAFIPLSRRLAS